MSSARTGPARTGAPAGDAAATARAGGWAAAAATYAPVAAAAATMLVLGLWGLERSSSMGNDEVITRWAALLPLHLLAHLLSHVDAVHGLYYLLMHGWMAVGTSPAVMRIPSVIGMTVAVALTVIIGRRLTRSGWAGLFAGLVMALTPSISYYAQTARSYALVVPCVLGSTLALLYAMQAETAGGTRARVVRRWLAYGALVVLAGYLNEMALLVLAAHGVTVLLARSGRRSAKHWLAAAAAAVAVAVPLLVVGARQTGIIGWIPRPNLYYLHVLFRDYFGPSIAVEVLLFGCAVAALLPPRGRWRGLPGGDAAQAAADPATPWWRRGGFSLPSVAAPLLVVPGSLLIIESLIARPLYVDRYVLYGEAGAALLAGAGMYQAGRWLAAAAGRRALVWAPGVAVCLCTLLLQLGAQHRARTPQVRLYDFGGPSRYVAAHARPGDGILYVSDFFRKAELGYPADFRNVSDFSLAVSPEQAGTFTGVDKPLPAVRSLMLSYPRIWVLGKGPAARLPPGRFQAERTLLESRFTLAAKRHFRGVVVTLWLRR